MINSYNILTGAATLNEIIEANIGVFAHSPDDEPRIEELELMLFYFQDHEMFEHCSDLLKYMEQNYDKDGKLRDKNCECDYPEIESYSRTMRCGYCKKRLRK